MPLEGGEKELTPEEVLLPEWCCEAAFTGVDFPIAG